MINAAMKGKLKNRKLYQEIFKYVEIKVIIIRLFFTNTFKILCSRATS